MEEGATNEGAEGYHVYQKGGFKVTVPVRAPIVGMELGEDASQSFLTERPAADPNPTVEHAFAEMIDVNPRERHLADGGGELLVVLDAANIGWAYGRDNTFDVTGVESAIRYFSSYRVTVTAFIPAGFVRKRPQEGSGGANAKMVTDEWERLNTLVQSGVLVVVPAGDDDDVYALHYARSNNGFIVSNDFYNNHVQKIAEESMKSSMKLWLGENRCSYTFSPTGELLINPACALAVTLPLVKLPSQALTLELAQAGAVAASAPLLAALASVDQTITQLVAIRRIEALKFALLSRLSLRFELGMRQGCFEDCSSVLSLVSYLFAWFVCIYQGINQSHQLYCTVSSNSPRLASLFLFTGT